MLAPCFRSANVHASFAEQGFLCMPLLDHGVLQEFNRDVRTLFPDVADGFVSSVWQTPAFRRRANDMIAPALDDLLRRVLTGYRIVLASFVVRSSGSNEQDMPLHQDWTFVDEAVAQSLGVWIPLQHVDTSNGCLQVVPGSHRHQQPMRAIGGGFRYSMLEVELREQYLVDVPAQAGDAVFFDHRLIHCSRPNTSSQPRFAVGAVLLPVGQALHLGFKQPDGSLRFEDVADDFLLSADLPAIARG